MGSGSPFKTALNIGTFGLSGAYESSKAQKKALAEQTEAMERAQQAQKVAQEKALKQQELAQEQVNQANERAQRSTANINRDVKNVKNSADLTGGIAKKANTSSASLGNGDTLGLDDEDWF